MLTRSYQTFPCPPKCKQWGFFKIMHCRDEWCGFPPLPNTHARTGPLAWTRSTAGSRTSSHTQGKDAPELPTAQRSTCAYLAGLHSLHWAHSLPFPQNYKLPWEELSCSSQGTWLLCKFWPPDFAPWRGNPIPDFLLGIISILLPELPGPAWPVSL